MENEHIATYVENEIRKGAGALRNLLIEGYTFDEALQHERYTFWLNSAREFANKHFYHNSNAK